jgi:Fe-S cluster assembly iron-binding protein IscA
MMVLTEAAAEVVKSVTSVPEAPESAGLRIASSIPEPRDPSSLELTAASGPDADDEVIETAGARVFLEPHAAAYLDDKVLDAQIDAQGNARFSVSRQRPPTEV